MFLRRWLDVGKLSTHRLRTWSFREGGRQYRRPAGWKNQQFRINQRVSGSPLDWRGDPLTFVQCGVQYRVCVIIVDKSEGVIWYPRTSSVLVGKRRVEETRDRVDTHWTYLGCLHRPWVVYKRPTQWVFLWFVYGLGPRDPVSSRSRVPRFVSWQLSSVLTVVNYIKCRCFPCTTSQCVCL